MSKFWGWRTCKRCGTEVRDLRSGETVERAKTQLYHPRLHNCVRIEQVRYASTIPDNFEPLFEACPWLKDDDAGV